MGLEDRRATVAAAMEAAEEGLDYTAAVEQVVAEASVESDESKTVLPPPEGGQEDSTKGGPDEPTPTKTDVLQAPKPAVVETKPDEVDDRPLYPAEKPPQAWKAAQKAKWDKLDPDIRQEVIRRERETTTVLNESAQARQFSHQFETAIQPFKARLGNVNPLQAVQNLLQADYLLATAPKAQKAQYLAKLIKDYSVDILELDAALTSSAPVDPVDHRVEQLLQQRLAPYQEFMTAQQQREQQALAAQNKQVADTVEAMSSDPEYPHFEAVRETMADIVDIMAKKGVSVDLKTAYNRAVAMDPTLSQVVASSAAAQVQAGLAAKANAKAQRALKASASVGGAPGGSIGGKLDASDRRAAIMAAFEAAGGR